MRLLPALLCLSAVGACLPAQVPQGHYVASMIRQNPFWGAIGGLAIVHPTGATPPIRVTGLTDDLTGIGAAWAGANCVAYRPVDGFLVVGELTPLGGRVDLHQIAVSGGAVVVDVPVFVGTGVLGGLVQPAINQIGVLANGDAVFCVSGLDGSGPLAGLPLGYFNRVTQSVNGIPLSTVPPGVPNGLVVDEVAGVIYFGMWGQGTVWSVPLAGGTPTLVAQVGSAIFNLALDENANLLVSNGSSTDRVDVTTGVVLGGYSISTALAVAVEHSTADPVVLIGNPLISTSTVLRLTVGGHVVTSGLTGLATGIAIVNSAREYGAGTPGLTDYRFRTFPGVGGLPIAGNTAYALRVDAANGNSNLGWAAMSFGASALPVFGFQLLVDPASAVSLGAFPAGSSIPLPLPTGLPPTQVFFQGVYLDAGRPSGLAATRGLQLTTIQ